MTNFGTIICIILLYLYEILTNARVAPLEKCGIGLVTHSRNFLFFFNFFVIWRFYVTIKVVKHL